MIADRTFTNRVVARVRRVERRRQRQESLRLFVPIGVMTLVAITWAIAVFDGVIALRLLIEIMALVVTIGNFEQHFALALLGPFAPIPLIVSLLLFIAAVGWVRIHQPPAPGERK